MSKYSFDVAEMDGKIFDAIRKVYGYDEEGDRLVDHFIYTADDAASYFGLHDELRHEAMYSGQFESRKED